MKKRILIICSVVLLFIFILITQQEEHFQSMTKEQFDEMLTMYPDAVGEWIVKEIVEQPRHLMWRPDKEELIGSTLEITENGNVYFNDKKQFIKSFENRTTDYIAGGLNYIYGAVESLMGGQDIINIETEDMWILVGKSGIYFSVIEAYSESGIYSIVRVE